MTSPQPARPQHQFQIKPLRLLGYVLLAAAVMKELRLPPKKRTWHGLVAGVVPYELRRPTVDRALDRLWSPKQPHVFMPTVFGVGWVPNVGRMVAVLRERMRT